MGRRREEEMERRHGKENGREERGRKQNLVLVRVAKPKHGPH